jgi:outer membrane receptor protein involved in Fe transport
VVTPARGEAESTFSVPEHLSVTSRREIDARPYTLLPQVLREEPGILLQQTTSAQISPIVRGFTGQSNVYLLDGVRFNTGAWRSGPSQYLSWIAGGPVDSIEVIRGAGSVQYGSDALGGTIALRSTPIIGGVRAPLSGSVELAAASADRSASGQADIAFRFRRAMVRVGGSRRSVGNLRAGEGIDSHSAVTRFFGISSEILGDRQPATSFNQGGVYGVADVGIGRAGALHGLFMHESQDGASRYDRVMGGEGLFRSGFEPQTLDLGLLRYETAVSGALHGISATFSVNRQADGRFEQARPTTRLDRQEGTTTALGYQLQAHRDFGMRHQLLVGTELYDENTTAFRELVEPTGVITQARPDIPDGTSYSNFGVFAQHRMDVVPDRLSVRGGLRFSSFTFESTPDDALGVIAQRETMRAMTFQAATVLKLTDGLNVTGSVNRGFRAANASDLGSIGLSGGGGFSITPSTAASLGAFVGSTGAAGAVSTGERVPGLRPEVVYQYEVGLKARVGPLSGSVNGFDMELYDFIQRRALVFDTNIVGTTIAGFEVVAMDATGLAYIAQDVRPIATSVNVDRGRIHGFDAEGELKLGRAWTTGAYFSMLTGRALPSGEFLRRMPPPMGGARLRWSNDRTWAEGVVTFAAEQTRLNSGDLGDARIGGLRTRSSIATFFNGTATDMGLVSGGILLATGETLAQVQNRVLGTANSAPLYTSHAGFVIVGLRGGIRLARHLDVAVIGENLADRNYRLYGSGLDAPGRNVQVRTRVRF